MFHAIQLNRHLVVNVLPKILHFCVLGWAFLQRYQSLSSLKTISEQRTSSLRIVCQFVLPMEGNFQSKSLFDFVLKTTA